MTNSSTSKATDPGWDKWRPCNPTSPHWYDESRLQRYLAAHVARDRDLGQHRTVREFIAEFRGLSGTAIQRKILTEVGCSHQPLSAVLRRRSGQSRWHRQAARGNEEAQQAGAPKHLGVIGREHLKQRFLAAGGNADTFKYQQRKGLTDEGIPYVVEVAFGLHQSGLSQGGRGASRKFVTGANWSAGITNPFRHFGTTGEGLENTLERYAPMPKSR